MDFLSEFLIGFVDMGQMASKTIVGQLNRVYFRVVMFC